MYTKNCKKLEGKEKISYKVKIWNQFELLQMICVFFRLLAAEIYMYLYVYIHAAVNSMKRIRKEKESKSRSSTNCTLFDR